MDIVEFYTARLDELYAAADLVLRPYGDNAATNGAEWWPVEREWFDIGLSSDETALVTRMTPQFVLADIAAKRAILAEHTDTPDRTEVCQWQYTSIAIGMEHTWPCDTLKMLVQPFADHPDFDPAWTVTR